MEITLSLNVYDINVVRWENYYEIMTPKNLIIRFSPDALEAFLKEVQLIKDKVNEPGS